MGGKYSLDTALMTPDEIEEAELEELRNPKISTVVAPELTELARFNMLRGWAKAGGAIGFDNIDFPASFCDNFSQNDAKYPILGVAAKKDIEHRMGMLAIPFDSLISVKTFQDEYPEIYEFAVNECPDLFSEDEQLDYEQLLITLYLMLEHTKGKTSRWFPYIATMP